MSFENYSQRENQKDVIRLGKQPVAATPLPIPAAPLAKTALALPVRLNDRDEEKILEIVREGLKHNRIDLFLQPIVKLPQRTRRFYECYSRSRGADGSMVLPAQFIGPARDHGLLDAIDNIQLFRCIQLVRRAQRHNHELGFFCNISMQTLSDRRFFPQFIEFMAANKSLASRLTFDLAAEDVDRQWDDIAEDLDRLAWLGFRFSMDRVPHMGFDPELMAGRHFKFVQVGAETLLNQNRNSNAQLRLMMRDLDRNAIDLIVDKVETQDQLIELLDLGIYFAQGYLFGEPRPSARG